MHVGFDGRDLLRKRTGVVNVTVHLARELSRAHLGEITVYADRAPMDTGEAPPPSVTLTTLSAPGPLWKHVALPMDLIRTRADVFHSPTGTLPFVAPCRQVVTMHDLFAEIEPTWFAPRVGVQLRTTQRRSAVKADRVIAVSERTRTDLVERYGIAPEKIRVVHNGVDHDRFYPRQVDPEMVARQFGVPCPFVLCVGSLMPWRNAARLLRATAKTGMGLLFVGRDIWGTDPTQRLAAENGWSWARFTGYVDDAVLPELYAAARVFACPSLYEGFGIPPVEAMATGTPVVASMAGALPEVLGDTALLVDPYDENALAEALIAAAGDGGVLRKRGLERAQRYRWDTAGRQTWSVYVDAAER
ncbi:MAG: glycosyltransferase family 1 protein [Chloroflexota bacterium]